MFPVKVYQFLVLTTLTFLSLFQSANSTTKSVDENKPEFSFLLPPKNFTGPHHHSHHHVIGKRETSKPPEILSFKVHSIIKNRYCRTNVVSEVKSYSWTNEEVIFSVFIPDTAFISNFFILVNSERYDAEVLPKQNASSLYIQAKSDNKTAGIVGSTTPDSNIFIIVVNVGPLAQLIFNLTYEELLQRKFGSYEHSIYINPLEVTKISNYEVQVDIADVREIVNVEVPSPYFTVDSRSEEDEDYDRNSSDDVDDYFNKDRDVDDNFDKNRDAEIKILSSNEATVRWSPNRTGNLADETDISSKFVVRYDVNRDANNGDLFLSRGHFVHFFAPDDLSPVKQHVVFVLDISGSIQGNKLKQLKKAQTSILHDMRQTDYFNIIVFNTRFHSWKPQSSVNGCSNKAIPATPQNVRDAVNFINKLYARGKTDIHMALKTGIDLVNSVRNVTIPSCGQNLSPGVKSLLVFLTDGEPTRGITDPNEISTKIFDYNSVNRIPIFTLGFGKDVDFPFLKKLSLQNQGFVRKIYEASDAGLQIENFYKEISSLLLTDINFRYVSNKVVVSDVTKTQFSEYFKGTELVVAGKVDLASYPCNTESNVLDLDDIIDGDVKGVGANGEPSVWEEVSAETFFEGACGLCNETKNISQTEPNSEATGDLRTHDDEFMESMWAYLTIRQLLDQDSAGMGNLEGEVRTAKEKALELAMRYGLVTPLTSLVVVTPTPPPPRELGLGQYSTMQVAETSYSGSHLMLHASQHFSRPITTTTTPSPIPTSRTTVDLKDAFGEASYFPATSPNRKPKLINNVVNLTRSMGMRQGYASMNDIAWLGENVYEMKLKGTVYKLRKEKLGFECTVNTTGESGQCRHLKDCVLPIFKDSGKALRPYICPIQASTRAGTYLGVCCPNNQATTSTSNRLTLGNITWLHDHLQELRLKGKVYKIYRQQDSRTSTDVSSSCSKFDAKHECVHLDECVRKDIANDFNVFKKHFCPIHRMAGRRRDSVVGVCCPLTTHET